MVFCCVYGCTNSEGNDVKHQAASFHRIPKVISHHDEETRKMSQLRREKWFNAIKRKDINVDATYYRVCSLHFSTGKPSKLFETKHPDWVPNKALGYDTPDQTASVARYSRSVNRSFNSSFTSTETETETELLPTTTSSQEIDFSVIGPRVESNFAVGGGDDVLAISVNEVTESMSRLSISTQTELSSKDIKNIIVTRKKIVWKHGPYILIFYCFRISS